MAVAMNGGEIGNLERTTDLEWLETNGIGGWASSTWSGAHTRRYHGLLVAATRPPVGRMVLLSRLDETVTVGGERRSLATCFFPGTVHPRGFESLSGFRVDPFPVCDFEALGIKLRKTVAARHGENTTVVSYRVLEAPGRFTLELRPLFAGRDYHALERARDEVRRDADFEGEVLGYSPAPGVPRVELRVPGARFVADPCWYYDYELPRERERGFDFREDLFTPGWLEVELTAGDTLGVVASTEPVAGRDAGQLIAAERRRRRRLLPKNGADGLCRDLTLAADAFIVERGSGHSLIAGYPWFADWGRDTMIALPGICLSTGRLSEARGILRAFAGATSQGMLPNRFPDSGEEPEYNTVDASLWFFQAVSRYLGASDDQRLVERELLPVLEDILEWHRRGTRYDIHQDRDGLLYAGVTGVQLTWMDARVGDWVVTPRQGKAVEVNALWLNALSVLADLRERFGRSGVAELRREIATGRRRFQELFWSVDDGWLYDCVDQRDGAPAISVDGSLRPNQLLALSLPLELLDRERALRVLGVVEERLLTPVGLRSLDPEDPRYAPRYEGGPAERDAAYHQGTVWPWLLGPFLTALVRLRGAAGRRQGRNILAALAARLADAGLGSVPEIFDAEPPHAPRGCLAQAWSVGELLRAAVEDLGLGGHSASDKRSSR